MVLNEKNCAQLNALVRVMRTKKVTKQEVMQMFDTNERTARDMLSEIAKKCPVISLSDGKGYRIVNRSIPDDIREAKHAYNENRKRAEEILKRNIPLAQALGISPGEVIMEGDSYGRTKNVRASDN